MRYQMHEKLFQLGKDSTIMNEVGEPVFEVEGKEVSLQKGLTIYDRYGNEVAGVHQRSFLSPTYQITRSGQALAEVRRQTTGPFTDGFIVDILGRDALEIEGASLNHEFTITHDGRVIATASKRWFAFQDTYGVDIAPGQDDVLILASVLALDLASRK